MHQDVIKVYRSIDNKIKDMEKDMEKHNSPILNTEN